jgi:uncharacterized membrane protein
MIREAFKKNIGMSEEFRFRGMEPGRLENFSDAVFALAITLLLISTTPPTNFQQVKRSVIDLIPFILCVVFIVLIWHQHFIFYFRYGLRNGKMVALNAAFLTIVLFYVYPLKFLTKLIEFPIAWLLNDTALWNELSGMISGKDMADLMIIYGLGATAVFFTLMQMYRFALKQAAELELNDIEIFDTKVSIRTNLLMGIVPIVSVLLALAFYTKWYAGMISGFSYFLYTPVMMIHGNMVNKKRKKLLENQGASSTITSEDLPTQ